MISCVRITRFDFREQSRGGVEGIIATVLSFFAFVVSLSFLATQTAPAQTKALKDGKSVCQVLVPADWQPDSDIPGIARDPKNLISVTVMWEQDYKVAPMTEMAIQMSSVEKMFENTAQRIFYQGKAVTFGPVPKTPWTVYTPAPQKGACHCAISMQPGADEQAAKKVALTLGPAK